MLLITSAEGSNSPFFSAEAVLIELIDLGEETSRVFLSMQTYFDVVW